jgi:hypothetical protein
VLILGEITAATAQPFKLQRSAVAVAGLTGVQELQMEFLVVRGVVLEERRAHKPLKEGLGLRDRAFLGGLWAHELGRKTPLELVVVVLVVLLQTVQTHLIMLEETVETECFLAG